MRPAHSQVPNRAQHLASERLFRSALSAQLADNQTDLYVLSARELTGIWINNQRSVGISEEDQDIIFEDLTGYTLTAVRDHSGTVTSSVVLARLGMDMHRSGKLFGTYRVIQRQGQSLIVFSGYAGLRKHLTAPTYGIANPKVIKMGVGIASANSALKQGATLTLILSPLIRTLEWLFVDQRKSLESVLAHISTDIAKGFIAAGAAYFLGGVIPTAVTTAGFSIAAVIPIGLGIAIAIAVGFALNGLDDKYGITNKLVEALVKSRDDWISARKETQRDLQRVNQDFNYFFGSPRGNLDFIYRLMGSGGWYGR